MTQFLTFTDSDGDPILLNVEDTIISISPTRITYGDKADFRGEWKLGSAIRTVNGLTVAVAETPKEVAAIIEQSNYA